MLAENTESNDAGREEPYMTDGSEGFQGCDDLSAPQICQKGHNGSSPHDQCKVPSLWSVVGKVEYGQTGNEVRD